MRRKLSLILGVIAVLATPLVPTASSGAGAELFKPRGVHLSFTADTATTTTAAWLTDTLADPHPFVTYGEARGPSDNPCAETPLNRRVSATSQPAPGVDALVHEATMVGLTPGATVCYRVGGNSFGGWSPVRAFHPAPRGPEPFSFIAFGDHGTRPQSQTTTARAVREDADLLLMLGDLSYANGNQPVWDVWQNQIEPLVATVPTMMALGNHEVEDAWVTQAFRARFAHPGEELYYSFDYANVHFLVVEAGAALEEAILAEEIAFVEADLASAVARRAAREIDFIVVAQHFPIWSNHDTRGPYDPALVGIEEQILQRYSVDLLLTGHNHHYERSKPMAYGQPTAEQTDTYTDPAGYIEVIAGGGGQSLYDFVAPEDFQAWSASWAKRYHYIRLDVSGPSLRLRAITTDDPAGQVIDEFTLHRVAAKVPAAAHPVVEVGLGP